MGTKRVGLARTQALIENLKRELDLNASTLKDFKIGGAGDAAASTGATGTSGTLSVQKASEALDITCIKKRCLWSELLRQMTMV